MGTHISQDCSNSEGALEYLKEGKGKRVLIVTDKRKVRKLELPSRELVADIPILDPKLPMLMPKRHTADTSLDALVHATDEYIIIPP